MSDSLQGQTGRIDVNSATLEQLESLMGVGRARAETIIEIRKRQNGFHSVNDLLKVPGLGPTFLEHNKASLSCNMKKSLNHDKEPRRRRHGTMTGTTDAINTPPSTERVEMRRTRSETAKLLDGNHTIPPHDLLMDAALDYKPTPPVTPLTTNPSKSSHTSAPTTHTPTHRHSKHQHTDTENHSSNDVVPTSSSRRGHPSTPRSERCQSDDDDVCVEHVVDDEITIKSRSASIGASDKHVMKRKSDARTTAKGPSPGKRPCRTADLANSRVVPTFGTIQTSGTQNMSLAAMKRRIPSRHNPPDDLPPFLQTFQGWSHAERLLALDEVISLCDATQVRHIMSVIEPQFQRDFISLLPKELALYVLSFLEPRDLLQAAQTCNYWRILADDNLLWREKCREESIDQYLVYGHKESSSSPSKSTRRGRHHTPCHNNSESNGPVNGPAWKDLFMRQHQIEMNWRHNSTQNYKVLKGHDDHVITCLEFCGNRIVSGSDDNTLKVWSADTGKCLRTLIGHTGGVWSSQMQGNIIISGSTDRSLKVWDADTGACTYTLYGHTSTVRCMHLHNNRVVSGSRDATLRLWDVTSGSCLHVLMGHVAAVRCVQYDGKYVVSGAYDYSVKVWDADSETCLHTLQGHTNRVYSLQFDGTHIVSGSLDTSIRVWDVETGNCLHTLIGHQSLTSGMELKDNILVSGNADSTVKVWDITTGQCLQTLQGPNKHQSAVTCLQFNKKFVITSSDDGTVKIWDLRRGEFVRNLVSLDSGGSGGVVWRVRCSNTRLVCAVGSRNGTEETKLLVLDFDCDEHFHGTNDAASVASTRDIDSDSGMEDSVGVERECAVSTRKQTAAAQSAST